jgi:trehalose-phosphatase
MEDLNRCEAMILDLDGVITDTRKLHTMAWKEILDSYLQQEKYPLFTMEEYDLFLDGKPREEGMKSFFTARKIAVPEIQIQNLSQRKNQRYLQLLKQHGPDVFEDTLQAIKKWKEKGLSVAVISSSKNCQEVLAQAGIEELFDVRVDGSMAREKHLKGKPEPDYFLEAARELGKEASQCMIFEDSIAGVEAGKKGHFGKVIGVSRKSQTDPEILYATGADLVVNTLADLNSLPHALKSWEKVTKKIGNKDLVLFLDFDGTLSEIVACPEQAEILPEIKQILGAISCCFKIAVISGRDRQDVKEKVGLENIFYAGCHGFDISGPGGFHYEVEKVEDTFPMLDEMERIFHELLLPEVLVERKKYSIALHYRNTNEETAKKLKQEVNKIKNRFPRLMMVPGKKIYEFRPAIEWGKGKAIAKLCEVLEVDHQKTMPFYLGDDVTDEDALQEIRDWGLGIKIGEEHLSTNASFWLRDPSEVAEFLKKVKHDYYGAEKKWRSGV